MKARPLLTPPHPPRQSYPVSFNTGWEEGDSDGVKDADSNATVTFLPVMDRELHH